MNSRVVLLLVFTSVAALILPSVSAGGYYCKKCENNPLQSPEACNMSNPAEHCGMNAKPCYALTAQLGNGTLVSTRGCYNGPEDSCNSTACEQVQNETGIAFKQCIADCCTDGQRCNQLVPAVDFMSTSTSSSSSSASGSSSSSTGGVTTTTKTTPTSSSTMKKGLRYLLVLLPSVLFILN